MRRRITAFLILLAMIVTLVPGSVFAYTPESGETVWIDATLPGSDVHYYIYQKPEIIDGQPTNTYRIVLEPEENGSNFNIPDYNNVTETPWGLLYQQIQYVVIEEGITGIGNNAFSNMVLLSDATIASTVTSIGESAFANDTRLSKEVLDLTNVTNLGESAFYNCDSIQSVILSDNLERIPNNLFNN